MTFRRGLIDKFEWICLTPSVATVTQGSYVTAHNVGETFIVGLSQPGNRVIRNIKLVVIPKPLTVVGTWVDTDKEFDNTTAACVAPGVLQGVLAHDLGSVMLSATAAYSSLGEGARTIHVRYSLSGSRAAGYVAPQDASYSGFIHMPGSGKFGDILGVIMEQDGEGVAHPYADARVAYAINRETTGVALTDAYGRYVVSGLGEGDVVELHPDVKRTWTIRPDSQQTVTASKTSGGIVCADTFTYVPDRGVLVSLTFSEDDSNLTLTSLNREEIEDTTHYRLPCGWNDTTLSIRYITPDSVTGELYVGEITEYMDEANAGVRQAEDAPNHIVVDVSKPSRKVFTIALSSGKSYTVVVEKPHGIFDFIIEHLGNIRVVNNNPLFNGGFRFASSEWYEKSNGKWKQVQSGDKLFYSAGPSIMDKFNPMDSMYVVLYTVDGDTLSTCPDADPNSKNNSSDNREAGAGDYAYAYPNPVTGGGKVYLKESILSADGEERYSTFRLYTSQGKLVVGGSASVFVEGFTMPEHPGSYYLILSGKAGKRAIQIAVIN